MQTELIVGFSIYVENLGQATDAVRSWLSAPQQRPKVIATINAHSAVVAQHDAEFSKALRDADILLPDGIGLVLTSRLFGGRLQERITGADLFHEIMQLAGEHGKRVFFLGTSEETLDKIVRKVAVDYPGVGELGAFSPPYKSEFDIDDDNQMTEAVSRFKPDVLWVGMTAPNSPW